MIAHANNYNITAHRLFLLHAFIELCQAENQRVVFIRQPLESCAYPSHCSVGVIATAGVDMLCIVNDGNARFGLELFNQFAFNLGHRLQPHGEHATVCRNRYCNSLSGRSNLLSSVAGSLGCVVAVDFFQLGKGLVAERYVVLIVVDKVLAVLKNLIEVASMSLRMLQTEVVMDVAQWLPCFADGFDHPLP